MSPQFHFLGIYVVASVAGGALQAGDDLDAASWFSLAGPLPVLGFEEDACAIELVKNGLAGLAMDLGQ